VDNGATKWTDALKERPETAAAADVLANPSKLVLCLYWGNIVGGHILADWPTQPTNIALGREKICRMISDGIKSAKPSDAADQRLLDVISEMLRSVNLTEDGTMVRVDFTSSLRWADLPSVFLHRSSATVEVKDDKK
jgi:hypothetical protein